MSNYPITCGQQIIRTSRGHLLLPQNAIAIDVSQLLKSIKSLSLTKLSAPVCVPRQVKNQNCGLQQDFKAYLARIFYPSQRGPGSHS